MEKGKVSRSRANALYRLSRQMGKCGVSIKFLHLSFPILLYHSVVVACQVFVPIFGKNPVFLEKTPC